MFSTDSLPYTKDGANVIHTMEKVKECIGFHYLLIDILVAHNIFRIQDDDSITYKFYCIAFIEYMIVGKTLLDYNTCTIFGRQKSTFIKN